MKKIVVFHFQHWGLSLNTERVYLRDQKYVKFKRICSQKGIGEQKAAINDGF